VKLDASREASVNSSTGSPCVCVCVCVCVCARVGTRTYERQSARFWASCYFGPVARAVPNFNPNKEHLSSTVMEAKALAKKEEFSRRC
jgi:hypothetical protein